MTRVPEIHGLEWRGIGIEIRYEPDWLGCVREDRVCHFDIEAITPERSPLPITETGYRSHFANPVEIDEAGGPVAFVTAWLDAAAQAPAWKEKEQAARQLTLF